VLAVYKGSALNALELLGGNNDCLGHGMTSCVLISGEALTTYGVCRQHVLQAG
jgi:hypothetical protein